MSNSSRRKWIQYTGIALLSYILQTKVGASNTLTTQIEYISPKEAYERVHRHGAKLIDVRTRDEYQNESIQGADSIPLSNNQDFVTLFQNKFPLDTVLILVCQTGMRSSNAAQKLIKAGYSHVFVVRGGLNEWKKQRIPLT